MEANGALAAARGYRDATLEISDSGSHFGVGFEFDFLSAFSRPYPNALLAARAGGAQAVQLGPKVGGAFSHVMRRCS